MVIQCTLLGVGLMLGILSVCLRKANVLLASLSVVFCSFAVLVASVAVRASHTFATVKQSYEGGQPPPGFVEGAKAASRIGIEQLSIFYAVTLGLGILLIVQAYRRRKDITEPKPDGDGPKPAP